METKTATLIMLDKPILVNEDKPKYGQKVLVNGETYSNYITEYRTSPCPPPYVSNVEICKLILAGHEGTKRLTFNLDDWDNKTIAEEFLRIFFRKRNGIHQEPKQYKVEYTETETEIIVTKIL